MAMKNQNIGKLKIFLFKTIRPRATEYEGLYQVF